MSNITGKITDIIKLLISPVSVAEDRISDSFHSYYLHLETVVISEQRYKLTLGYVIISEKSRQV